MNFFEIIQRREIEFLDRNQIVAYFRQQYERLLNEPEYLKIINLFGMGGIGKSRLIKALLDILKERKTKDVLTINFSLEVIKSDNILDILVNLRKMISKSCPFFDYALLTLWDRMEIRKLNTDFMETITRQISSAFSFLSGLTNISISAFKFELPLEKILDMAKVIYDHAANQYKGHIFCERFKSVESFTNDELLSCLAGFLGTDIAANLAEKRLIIFFDAYECYKQDLHESWLTDFIETIHQGLFIVTGREKIEWTAALSPFVSARCLDTLPEQEVRTLLHTHFPEIALEQEENILKTTECIPIYLDLAINTYHKAKDIDREIVMFKNTADIIDKFFDHLTKAVQQTLLVLSIIQIFDRDIFEYIIKELNLGISVLEYDIIYQLSLVQNTEDNNHFYKIHDVISDNVIKTTSYSMRYRVYECYVKFVASHTFFLIDDTQKIMLYKHLLNVALKNQFCLKVKETEHILDMFFSIKQTLLPIEYFSVDGYGPESTLRNLYFFARAVYEEREDTRQRVDWLEKIDASACDFGKHKKSYDILFCYLSHLVKKYSNYEQMLREINERLQPQETLEWYYGQTKIYLGDRLITTGAFKEGIHKLNNYDKELLKYRELKNTRFQVARHLGHAYRFNMFVEEAESYYRSALEVGYSQPTQIQRAYIITNLCENACYLDPDKVFALAYKGLHLAHNMRDLKSQAKIYYSLAVVMLHKKKYGLARKYIRKSARLNLQDGYRHGLLNAILVQIFLKAARKESYKKYYHQLATLQKELGNYGFLLLPIAILQNDRQWIESLKCSYEWLNFELSKQHYISFLTSLGISIAE